MSSPSSVRAELQFRQGELQPSRAEHSSVQVLQFIKGCAGLRRAADLLICDLLTGQVGLLVLVLVAVALRATTKSQACLGCGVCRRFVSHVACHDAAPSHFASASLHSWAVGRLKPILLAINVATPNHNRASATSSYVSSSPRTRSSS